MNDIRIKFLCAYTVEKGASHFFYFFKRVVNILLLMINLFCNILIMTNISLNIQWMTSHYPALLKCCVWRKEVFACGIIMSCMQFPIKTDFLALRNNCTLLNYFFDDALLGIESMIYHASPCMFCFLFKYTIVFFFLLDSPHTEYIFIHFQDGFKNCFTYFSVRNIYKPIFLIK